MFMKHNKTELAIVRRKFAIPRLEKQLKTNTKNTKEGIVQLSEQDIIRIKKELETLKSRL